MRARIHGGPQRQVEDDLFDAWRTDALAGDDAGNGRRSVLMIVSTNEQAAVLSERARHTLVETGVVSAGPAVRLCDNVASVGDHIVTRCNDRRLRTSNRGWVVNGDVWTVVNVYPDGAADARRHADGATITLPADYLAQHCHLGYATTAHRAQGMTVDVCHAAITADMSHQALYVAATRGRDGNHLWVTTDSDRDVVRDPDYLPAPEQVLSGVLERRDPDRLSAHQVIADSLTDMTRLARLGQVFEDAARTATDRWLRELLAGQGLAGATDDREWPTLLTTARQVALAGHDLDMLIDDAIAMRPLDGAHSTAAILHWRISTLMATSVPRRPRGPLTSLPPTDGPAMMVARRAGELIRQRWRQIRATLDNTTDALPWAPSLGAPPLHPRDRMAWRTAATAVTAFRERYEVPDYTPMIGHRPSSSRPDAQAAWDHARLQADRYLARRLHVLTDEQLDELDSRQQTLISQQPSFDPAELESVRRTHGRAGHHVASRHVVGPESSGPLRQLHQLEALAARHGQWRDLAREAEALRRQIAQERHRRTYRARTHRRAR